MLLYADMQYACVCVAVQDELKVTAKQLGEVKAQLGATKAMVRVVCTIREGGGVSLKTGG
jgi:hypothetical protein